jgi:hypothetical protein
MKFAAVALILLAVAEAWGGGGKPQPVAAVYYQDSSAQLIPLESQVVRIKYKYRGFAGFAGGTMVFRVEGGRSPVRIMAEPKLELVARIEGSIDPLETITFYHFDQVNGSRAAPIGDFSALGHVTKVIVNAAMIDFNAVKQGDASFKLIPIQVLVPGEYCLIIREGTPYPKKTQGFCFGVDAAGN